jgi:predicted permease
MSLLPRLSVPLELSLPLDGWTVAFTAGLSFVAAVLSGLMPALQSSRPDVITTLKDEAAALSSGSRLRNAFVLSQVALSIVLVTGAGVFVRAVQKATSIDPGYDPYGVEIASLDLSLASYTPATGPQFLNELADRVRTLPGVQDASIAASLPAGGPSFYGFVSHPGGELSPGNQRLSAEWNVVQPQYFSTMRIPLVAGRDFNDSDREGAQRVIIVSQEAARRWWPGQDPIGKILLHHPGVIRRGQDNSPKSVIVVGVVGDVKRTLRETARPHVYLPLQQQFVPSVILAARTTNGQRIAGPIREIVTSLNRTLPVLTSQTLEEAMALMLLPQRIGAFLSGSLGLVGLLLATMGIYGVTAFIVAQRTREIGIRLALGATRAAIVELVLRFGVKVVAGGTAVGLLIAATLHAVLTRVFFGFPPIDAIPFVASALLFLVIGMTACVVPVRRAMRVDPLTVLRYE